MRSPTEGFFDDGLRSAVDQGRDQDSGISSCPAAGTALNACDSCVIRRWFARSFAAFMAPRLPLHELPDSSGLHSAFLFELSFSDMEG